MDMDKLDIDKLNCIMFAFCSFTTIILGILLIYAKNDVYAFSICAITSLLMIIISNQFKTFIYIKK